MYIGVDVGGMSIKTGVVNHEGDIIAKAAVPTPSNNNNAFCKAMLKSITDAMTAAELKPSDIEAIGVGSPGMVDRENGVLKKASNIGFSNVPVRKYLKENIADVNVLVENDANCAALGEFYKTNNLKNFIYITLGTGVGGGIIINGSLFTGSDGAGGELGHMVTHAGGRKCSCGRKGCWETYASVKGLIKTTCEHREEIKGISPDEKITGRTVFDLARKGDDAARRVRDMWIEEVAVGIVDMINIFRPDEILIGGAVSKEGDTLLLPIIDFVNKNAFGSGELSMPRIAISRVGEDAGIIGAAMLYKNIKG